MTNQKSGIKFLQRLRFCLCNYKNLLFVITLTAVLSLPSFSHAVDTNIQNYGTNQYAPLLTGEQTCATPPRNFREFVCVVTNNILSPLIPILITIALIVFLWGVARYVIKGADDEKEREQGKQIMIYGIIGLFVMVSVWGLVAIVSNTFNLGNAPFDSSRVRIP